MFLLSRQEKSTLSWKQLICTKSLPMLPNVFLKKCFRQIVSSSWIYKKILPDIGTKYDSSKCSAIFYPMQLNLEKANQYIFAWNHQGMKQELPLPIMALLFPKTNKNVFFHSLKEGEMQRIFMAWELVCI